MTVMSQLSILPEMNLHLHPITIRTIQQTCRRNMKVRKTMRYTDQEDGESEDSQRTRSYDDHQADLVLMKHIGHS